MSESESMLPGYNVRFSNCDNQFEATLVDDNGEIAGYYHADNRKTGECETPTPISSTLLEAVDLPPKYEDCRSDSTQPADVFGDARGLAGINDVREVVRYWNTMRRANRPRRASLEPLPSYLKPMVDMSFNEVIRALRVYLPYDTDGEFRKQLAKPMRDAADKGIVAGENTYYAELLSHVADAFEDGTAECWPERGSDESADDYARKIWDYVFSFDPAIKNESTPLA